MPVGKAYEAEREKERLVRWMPMAATKVRYDVNDDTEFHSEHLCYIVSQGMHLADEVAYQALIEAPRFRCSHCGRTAKSRRNLCVPDDL